MEAMGELSTEFRTYHYLSGLVLVELALVLDGKSVLNVCLFVCLFIYLFVCLCVYLLFCIDIGSGGTALVLDGKSVLNVCLFVCLFVLCWYW